MLINIGIIFKLISRAIFPRKCIGCKTYDFWICEKCISKVPKSFENTFSWSYSIFKYQNKLIRKAIWLIKFNKKHSVLNDLEKTIVENFDIFIKKNNLKNKKIILVPIPITKKSMNKRRYNQSTLICKILIKDKEDFKLEESFLKKTKNHSPQNKIKNRATRLENVRNSFGVGNVEKIKSQTIVLIDDVVTTGATLKEARKVLKTSGARKVLAFVLAH